MDYIKVVHEFVLNELLERAKDGGYTCLRGPRPSGALLVAKSGCKVYGDVSPTEGVESCKDAGQCMMEHNHCVRNVHAEVDAIMAAARMGISTIAGTMYTINKPCFNCMKVCAKAGISKIVYAYAVYDEERTNDVAKGANMELIHVPID